MKLFGKELILDLGKCSHRISDRVFLVEFAAELCSKIDMKAYGECQTPYFGTNSDLTKGYSLLQFIETSSITGHFSDTFRTAHLNIFSCKDFDADVAAEFCAKFFGAIIVNKTVLDRYMEK